MSNKKGIFFTILYIALSLVLTFLVIWRCNSIYGSEGLTVSFFFVCIASFALSYVISVLLHELGHLVFAKRNGMLVNGFTVLFLTFYKKDGKLKVSLSKNVDTAGVCELYPVSDENIENNYFWTSIGGSIFTGIYMAFSLIVFLLGGFTGVWWLYLFIALQLPYTFYNFAINITPLNIFGRKTDGAIIWEIKHKDDSAFVAIKVLKIQALMYKGKTPSEIDRDTFFKAPQLSADDVQYAFITNLRCMYYLDEGNFEKAIKHYERLQEIYQEVSDEYAEMLAGELCYYHSALLNDKETSKQFYEVVEKSLNLQKTPTNYRVSAAYKWYSLNDRESALADIKSGEEVAKNYFVSGIGKYETKLLERIKADIK